MAGRFRKVAFLAALISLGILCAPCFAQGPAASPAPADEGGNQNRPFKKEKGGNPEGPRKIFENLTPEQQQKVRENLERWQKMTPEERKALREREQLRRQKILEEVDKAIKESGLQLDEKTREMYILRYTQERRVIEERLQKEMEEKRRPQLQELINRLKTEFQDKSSAASSASPSPSPATASPAK